MSIIRRISTRSLKDWSKTLSDIPDVIDVIRVTAEPNWRVRVLYADGLELVADLSHLPGLGGVFQPLADPEFFKQVSVGGNGAFITWPGDIDICPDTLRN